MPKKLYGDKPYRLITELGECLILPAEQFVRMHSEKRLSFAAIIRVDFHGHLPGFGPYNLLMHKNMLAQTLIRKRLTKSLNGLVEPLSTETAFAVKTVFGETSVDVFRVEGMTSAALSKMKLLDSALKEGIRVVPMASLNIRRGATADFVTPDGVEIKKSDRLFVDATKVTDPNVYPEPAKYDIYRYYNIRDNAITAAKAQLVGTTAENLAFGYGVHACPGRFFAANENKLILCHLLLKHAWELCPGSTLEAYPLVSTMFGLDPNVKIRYRSRKPELDLVPL
ncbi:CypX Cytochrome P450 [Pyrenophora teres f. maculata]|nr:CypX Cytochrome P450 [Pyrenophora teres f. maculata]